MPKWIDDGVPDPSGWSPLRDLFLGSCPLKSPWSECVFSLVPPFPQSLTPKSKWLLVVFHISTCFSIFSICSHISLNIYPQDFGTSQFHPTCLGHNLLDLNRWNKKLGANWPNSWPKHAIWGAQGLPKSWMVSDWKIPKIDAWDNP